MLATVEQIITEWFKDSRDGINAIAAQLPRTRLTPRADGAMTDDAPATVTIVCAADTPSVALKLEPAQAPAVVVRAIVAADAPAKGYRIANEIPVAVFFMVEETADDQASNDLAGYIMRAAKLSLARFNSERLAGAAREHNGVAIKKIVRITEYRAPESNGRYKTPAFLEVIVTALDAFGSPTPATLGALAAAG